MPSRPTSSKRNAAQTARSDSQKRFPQVPWPVRSVVIAVGALIVVLAALPIAMVVNPDPYTESIVRAEPNLPPDQLGFAHTVAITFTVAVHAVFALVVSWLTAKTWRGRRWARVSLTVTMLLGLLSSVRSAQDGPAFFLPVVAGDLILVAIIILLWAPGSARRFFAAGRTTT